MFWKRRSTETFLKEIDRLLRPIYLTANTHKKNNDLKYALDTLAVFDPDINAIFDVMLVDECFAGKVSPKECALRLVDSRLRSYGVRRLAVIVDSELLGPACKLTEQSNSN